MCIWTFKTIIYAHLKGNDDIYLHHYCIKIEENAKANFWGTQ